jgi:hypothetical protein
MCWSVGVEAEVAAVAAEVVAVAAGVTAVAGGLFIGGFSAAGGETEVSER